MENKLTKWLKQTLASENLIVFPLPGDASPRRYYRVTVGEQCFVAMMVQEDTASMRPFLAIDKAWKALGVNVPEIFAVDSSQGFILLSDFGDRLLQDELTEHNVDRYYQKALGQQKLFQDAVTSSHYVYPQFDEAHILMELGYFTEWCLSKLLGIALDSEKGLLSALFAELVEYCKIQPQVVIHRDFHSRNLMRLPNDELGVIDFQDAMIGPLTYDWVSLTKDCYIAWPPEKITTWLRNFYERSRAEHFTLPDFDEFELWFDMTGLQRHLKVLGIFSRLYLRDQKPGYLREIPRILNYISAVTGRYAHLQTVHAWLLTMVWPVLQEQVELVQTHQLKKEA